MSRVDRFLDSLTTRALTDPKKRFAELARFAGELERELAALGPSSSTLVRWVHCSERLPAHAGQYAVIAYDPKSDGTVLGANAFAEGGAFTAAHPDFVVAYWLERLELPGAQAASRVMSFLTRRKPDSQVAPKPAGAAGSRVERFIASLPDYHATGPKTRMRLLESFAMQLERELEEAAQPDREAPRWVSCEDRYPRTAGNYLVVVDRPEESLALAALPFDGRTFASSVPETHVHFWLEGLEIPAFT